MNGPMDMTKILVIEDAASLRKDILEMLGYEGYEVSGAENGQVGVQRARELHPDLIICDIMMPQLDGYGVLAELNKDTRTAAIPFIFLTARTDRGDVRAGMELGADDFLTKPFTAKELLGSIQTRLEKRATLEAVGEQKLDDLRGNIILALPHELRTPLNVILGFSDLIIGDAYTIDPPRLTEMAQLIHNSAQRLYRLVENFITYANVEMLTTNPAQFETLRSVASQYLFMSVESDARQRARIYERESDLRFDVEEVAVAFPADYFKKVVEELVDNACKFSEAGKPIAVVGRRVDGSYVLTVTDEGRGMTQAQIDSIGAIMQFDRRIFEQQGIGLGLVISKRLVELFNGELTLESNLDVGTTVRVCVPLPG